MGFDAKRLSPRGTQDGATNKPSVAGVEHPLPVNDTFAVCDTWPEQVPISPREVETIEIYLGRILDELLRARGVHQTGKHQ